MKTTEEERESWAEDAFDSLAVKLSQDEMQRLLDDVTELMKEYNRLLMSILETDGDDSALVDLYERERKANETK